MDKITNKNVKNYVDKVKKMFDAQVILFGSRAGKNFLIESDYDLCVVSESFKGVTIQKRMQRLYELMIKNPFNADILAVTPEEFKKTFKTNNNL